ncbi:conserved hypothetical protein [Ricinus communis]|uniref:FAF domain-containing protein n=1 Tax=Ricinus communis TaxID=3988 RepID=B9RTY1_RICCO|nr:conserved hypothetical protein [Ricinus communis]
MATIVCQGLQSCLESQLVESRTLRLRLSSPKPHFSQSLELALKPCPLDCNTKEVRERRHHDEDKQTSSSSFQKPDMGGWSFLQALPNTSKESMEKENVYVHPLIKRNSSMLSEKSLELCTENLGSESGTIDIIDNSIFSSSLSSLLSESETGNSPTREQQQLQARQLLGAKKANCIRSFPPPLTTISGSESLQVRPHREDGRLIIKAAKVPSRHSHFQADRSEGRLRLRFVEDSASNFDLDEENKATRKEDQFQRPRRCKEGGELENKGLLNWELFWVATS